MLILLAPLTGCCAVVRAWGFDLGHAEDDLTVAPPGWRRASMMLAAMNAIPSLLKQTVGTELRKVAEKDSGARPQQDRRSHGRPVRRLLQKHLQLNARKRPLHGPADHA
jgi:hypothetical protein